MRIHFGREVQWYKILQSLIHIIHSKKSMVNILMYLQFENMHLITNNGCVGP